MKFAALFVALGVSVVTAAMFGLAEPPSGGGADPLAGPKVPERRAMFGFGGEFKRETLRPEEAALRGLDLSAEQRAAIDRHFNQRGRAITRFLLGHIDLLNRLNVSGSAGDQRTAADLLFQAAGRFEASGFRGDLTGLIRAEVPEGPLREAFDRAMSDYWIMVAMEKTGKLRSALTRGDVYGARLQESIEILGKEFEAAFQRAERSGEFVVAYLLDGLGLSKAQREKVDTIVFNGLEAMAPEAPEAEKVKLFLGVFAYLTEEQRAKVMRKINGD
jgi:hypothetical protein